MKINIKNNESLVVPKTGSEKSAGYDIVATSDPIIVGRKADETSWFAIDYIEYKTGVFIAPQNDSNDKSYHTYIFPRSSISKYNLSLCNSVGLIDNDYRGEIGFRFKYVIQPEDLTMVNGGYATNVNLEKIYKKGDKIGQLVAEETNRIEFVSVDDLDKTERGNGGFGSTDKQTTTVEGTMKSFNALIDNEVELIRIRGTSPKIVELTEPPERKFSEDKPYNKTTKSSILDKWKENTNKTDVVGYEKMVKERETN